MGAPSKIAVGLWGREGTAHFRRLTPPSFAAQSPTQSAAQHQAQCSLRTHDRSAGAEGCSHRASARGSPSVKGNRAQSGCSRRPRAAGKPLTRAQATRLGCSPRPRPRGNPRERAAAERRRGRRAQNSLTEVMPLSWRAAAIFSRADLWIWETRLSLMPSMPPISFIVSSLE